MASAFAAPSGHADTEQLLGSLDDQMHCGMVNDRYEVAAGHQPGRLGRFTGFGPSQKRHHHACAIGCAASVLALKLEPKKIVQVALGRCGSPASTPPSEHP